MPSRFSISQDSGPRAGGDQWVFQVQCYPQKADLFARDRGVGES